MKPGFFLAALTPKHTHDKFSNQSLEDHLIFLSLILSTSVFGLVNVHETQPVRQISMCVRWKKRSRNRQNIYLWHGSDRGHGRRWEAFDKPNSWRRTGTRWYHCQSWRSDVCTPDRGWSAFEPVKKMVRIWAGNFWNNFESKVTLNALKKSPLQQHLQQLEARPATAKSKTCNSWKQDLRQLDAFTYIFKFSVDFSTQSLPR